MKKNITQSKPGTPTMPPKVQQAVKIFQRYVAGLPKQGKTEAELQEQARKDRVYEGDVIYGDICARSGFLHQMSEVLFLLAATSSAGLPDQLDCVFAEMQDRAGEIDGLAKKLFETLTGAGSKPEEEGSHEEE